MIQITTKKPKDSIYPLNFILTDNKQQYLIEWYVSHSNKSLDSNTLNIDNFTVNGQVPSPDWYKKLSDMNLDIVNFFDYENANYIPNYMDTTINIIDKENNKGYTKMLIAALTKEISHEEAEVDFEII